MKEVAFAVFLALALHYGIRALADNRQVYYVTLPYEIKSGHAVKVMGSDRIDALSRMGATVWTEQEW